MSRRVIVIIAALSLVMSFASVASSDEHPPFVEHPHMLLIGIEFDETGEPVGFRKCVDLAGNRAVPLHAHHEMLHFGIGGKQMRERGKNVNMVVPAAPFPFGPVSEDQPEPPLPWTDCASFIEFISSE